jgi:hypothetical protein
MGETGVSTRRLVPGYHEASSYATNENHRQALCW